MKAQDRFARARVLADCTVEIDMIPGDETIIKIRDQEDGELAGDADLVALPCWRS